MEQKLDIGACIRFGWTTFKTRPWYFIGVFVLLIIVQSVFRFPSLDKTHDARLTPLYFLLAILSFVVSVIIDMVMRSFSLKAHDDPRSVSLRTAWTAGILLRYFGTTILVAVCVVVGFILLIVPGIILSLALIFALYVVIEKKMGPVEAVKESMRLTKGHRLNLLGLMLALILLNLLGLLALVVGLLVTVPVTMFALAHAYRTLSGTTVVTTPPESAAVAQAS
jgi:uncharacterized membrane protein